jgi:oligosaccharide reducing-end xylanase
VLALAGVLGACSPTVDSIGHGHDPETSATVVAPQPPLVPLVGPVAYENPLHDLLGMTTKAIDKRLADTFQQLFYGDPDSEAIYFTMGDDEAYIEDTYHDDVRSEGVGLGMLITVELNKRTEFDKLWRYAKEQLRIQTGSSAGYFNSYCDTTSGSMVCVDPYGAQMFAMSLLLAHDRWTTNDIDYGADALAIFDVMLHKEQQNGGIVDGVTDTFDAETNLVFDVPYTFAASRTRPSILMPAFYKLWAQATGNAFFDTAAESARSFFPTVVDGTTGLVPLRAYFDGTPTPGYDTFTSEAYRFFPNLVLDEIWTPGSTWGVTAEFNRVLSFFLAQGLDSYGTDYELDGTVVPGETAHEPALVLVNGVTALKATIADQDRQSFIQAVWDMQTPTGKARYYQGVLQLFALLVLSGEMQVY